MSGIVGSLFNIKGGSGPVAAMGTDGQQLTSQGAGIKCQFEAAAGGGKILQFKGSQETDEHKVTGGGGNVVATTWTVAITPTSASSKLLVGYNAYAVFYDSNQTNAAGGFELYRDVGGGGYARLSPTLDGTVASAGCYGTSFTLNDASGYHYHPQRVSNIFWDPSSGTTSEVTFKMYISENEENDNYFTICPSGYSRTIWCAEVDQS